MRFRVSRNRLFTRAVAALLALVVCGGALGWGHVGGDGRDCDIVVVRHDHNAHRFSASPTTAPPDEHCYLCHSLRLLHHAVATHYERVAAPLQVGLRPAADVLATRDGLKFGLGSRAPPSVRL